MADYCGPMRSVMAGFRMSVLALAVLAAGCGSSDAPATADPTGATGELTVFAAASLTDAFGEIGDAFSAAHPGVSVTFNFAGSSDLVTQITQGAPADVFASADTNNMAKLVDGGANSGDPVVFARNRSEIIVAPGNPLGITGVDDLTDPQLIVVTCAPQVPCGSYAAQIFEHAGVEVTPDSLEENVKAVVTKVTLGEADAGIAYATDVIAAGDAADGVPIPDEQNVVADYPIALTAESSQHELGQAFIDFVLSDEGQAVLATYGFTAP